MTHASVWPLHDVQTQVCEDEFPDEEAELWGEFAEQKALGLGVVGRGDACSCLGLCLCLCLRFCLCFSLLGLVREVSESGGFATCYGVSSLFDHVSLPMSVCISVDALWYRCASTSSQENTPCLILAIAVLYSMNFP